MRPMKKHGRWAGLPFLLVLLLAGFARPADAVEAVDPFVQIKRLGRGVNVLGYDPIWDDFGKARFTERHFRLIHDAGFQTVRINLHALQRLSA
jgi:endoglucanase